MRKAELADKGKVISILTESFFDNKSVNYIVQNDDKIKDRIRYLMEYSFEQCLLSGEILSLMMATAARWCSISTGRKPAWTPSCLT